MIKNNGLTNYFTKAVSSKINSDTNNPLHTLNIQMPKLTTILIALLFSTPLLADSNDTKEISWNPWALQAFEQAKKQNKLINIDVGVEGCTACRRMEEVTYTDPRVQALLDEHFISIKVDADARPDLGERYSDWAWPALIMLAPDATQVMAIAGNKTPKNYIAILEGLISAHKDGTLKEAGNAPYSAPPRPADTPISQMLSQAQRQVGRSYNASVGGFGSRAQSTDVALQVHWLFMRELTGRDPQGFAKGIKTADGFLNIIDPVWGGIFVAGVRNWSIVIPEKRIQNQAAALFAFANAYEVTGDEKYLQGAADIDRYVKNFLLADDGAFFTAQEDDAPGLTAGVSARDYFALNDSDRRKYGVPPVDHAVYVDRNALMIRAYSRMYEASQDPRYLKRAERAALALVTSRLSKRGVMRQEVANAQRVQDNRMRAIDARHISRAFLQPQAGFGLATMDLYRVTGNGQWLTLSQTLVGAMRNHLEDTSIGGFYAAEPDETQAIVPPRKPLEENAMAANLLYQLGVYTKDDALVALATRTLQASATPQIIRREGRATGELVVALETLNAQYVEMSIVGAEDDPAAQALFEAGLATYEPRKLLHFEAPGRYPQRDRAALYVCNPSVCSPPVFEPNQVAAATDRVRKIHQQAVPLSTPLTSAQVSSKAVLAGGQ